MPDVVMGDVTLVTDDGGRETITRDEAKQSVIITEMIQNLGMADNPEPVEIPLLGSNISGQTLKKVVEWTKKFANSRRAAPPTTPTPSGAAAAGSSSSAGRPLDRAAASADSPPPAVERRLVEQWEIDFMNSLDSEELHRVINAANYLQHDSLLDGSLTCVARIMQGRTTEELRELLGIPNDFTPEEHERENVWLGD
ncbi:E3 ubiquitin ligase complex SCF subunit [Aphelenchoides fujianensis]|nr:E3 ubiquitin ligase complex SCF subunit [Aphelenchoides fujianensis]